MAREKQEQEEARKKLEVSKIQIPQEQPGFSAMLGEKGIFEKMFLWDQCFGRWRWRSTRPGDQEKIIFQMLLES